MSYHGPNLRDQESARSTVIATQWVVRAAGDRCRKPSQLKRGLDIAEMHVASWHETHRAIVPQRDARFALTRTAARIVTRDKCASNELIVPFKVNIKRILREKGIW